MSEAGAGSVDEATTSGHKIALESVEVSADITGLTSTITLSQRFQNVGSLAAELSYDLRLFAGDTLLRFEAKQGEAQIVLETAAANGDAREDQSALAVDAGESGESGSDSDAPDLDWINDAFDSISPDGPTKPPEEASPDPIVREHQLGPLAPGEGLLITCQYKTAITREGPRRTLQIPLAALPGSLAARVAEATTKAQTDAVKVTIDAMLPTTGWPKAITSTSHPITTARVGEQHQITCEQAELPALQHFLLRWEVAERATEGPAATPQPAARKSSASLLLANRSSKVEGLIENELLSHLGSQHNVPAIDIAAFSPEDETLQLITKEICARHRLLPVNRAGNTLVLAMADPSNIVAIDEIKFMTGLNIEVVVATELSFVMAFEKFYGATGEEALASAAQSATRTHTDSQLRVPTNLKASGPPKRTKARSAAAAEAKSPASSPAVSKPAPPSSPVKATAKSREDIPSYPPVAKARPGVGPAPPERKHPGSLSGTRPPASFGQMPQAAPQETKALLRKGVIRYYERMNPGKPFPLLVSLLKADLSISRPDQRNVQQTTSQRTLSLAENSPYVRIVPVLPGCQVSPPEMIVNVTNPKVDAGFWVTPTITADLQASAVVQIWHENELKDEIPIPTKLSTQTWTKVLAAGSACMTGLTIFASLNDWRHIPSKAVKALPSATELLNEKLASTFLKWFAFIDTAGIALIVLLLVATTICYVLLRPRMADPLERFLQSEIDLK